MTIKTMKLIWFFKLRPSKDLFKTKIFGVDMLMKATVY